jgi:putative ABC transport system ATP-binding protein
MSAAVEASPEPTVLVSCVGAAHTYGAGDTAVVAAHDITCEVTAHSRIAITGPSGSGKSTVLYLLAGLVAATSGTVSRAGLGGSPIGFVFQGPSLMPALDVTENVCFPLLIAGLSDAEARTRARTALARLELLDLARALPQELSGGQSQRVTIARALATNPALIVADEPTGQLDHPTGERVLDVLLETADQLGAGLVVSTHDPVVARRLETRWAMHDGQLVLTTEPKRLKSAGLS